MSIVSKIQQAFGFYAQPKAVAVAPALALTLTTTQLTQLTGEQIFMATTTTPPTQPPLTQSEIDQDVAALNTLVTQIAASFTAYQSQIATLTSTNASQAATIVQLEGSVSALSIAGLQQPIQALSALANAGKTS